LCFWGPLFVPLLPYIYRSFVMKISLVMRVCVMCLIVYAFPV
jgi:hypothetical protein